MHLRTEDDGPWQFDARDDSRRASGRARLSTGRMEQIRERISLDVYCSVEVVDEIARRILRSHDL